MIDRMRRAAVRLFVLVGAAAAMASAAACKRGAAESGEQLSVRWARADRTDSTGALAAPASAQWCATGRYLAIKATRADTGFAIAILPKDTARARLAGRYPLRERLIDSTRPVAAVALRWADLSAVSAFRSDSGVVVLRRGADGRLAGEITANGRLLGGTPRRLKVTGSFRDVSVTPAPASCPDLMEYPKDTGIHFPNADTLLQRLRLRRPDLFPQGLRPQGGGGRPPQRGLPQRGGRSLPSP